MAVASLPPPAGPAHKRGTALAHKALPPTAHTQTGAAVHAQHNLYIFLPALTSPAAANCWPVPESTIIVVASINRYCNLWHVPFGSIWQLILVSVTYLNKQTVQQAPQKSPRELFSLCQKVIIIVNISKVLTEIERKN